MKNLIVEALELERCCHLVLFVIGSFPDVILSESLILYFFFASLKAEILLFLSFRFFFPIIWRIHFFFMFMGTFSFPFNFSRFVIDPRWI